MGTWRTQVLMTWSGASGSPGTNTWVFRDASVGGDQTLDTASSRLHDFYVAVRGIYPNACTISSDGIWTGVQGGNLGQTSQQDPWSTTGQAGSGFLPPATTIVLQRLTNAGGRSGRGRVFLGPLGQSTSDSSGKVAQGTIDLVLPAARALVLALPDGDGAFGVYSRKDGVERDIVDFRVDSPFGSLRSRRD